MNYEYNTKNATIKENNPVASAKANFVITLTLLPQHSPPSSGYILFRCF